MQLKHLLVVIPAIVAPVFGLGRECCCERYTQFNLDNVTQIVQHCQSLWTDNKNGKSNQDYCESLFCIENQSWDSWGNAAKCVVAGYQCGDCASGNVGCLGG